MNPIRVPSGALHALAAGVFLVTLVVLGVPCARAADEGSPKALAEQIKGAQKKKDAAELAALVEKAAAAHDGADAAGKKLLQGALGAVLKDKHAGEARSAAAAALGRLDDPDGAFKQLSKAVPGPKDETTAPYQVEALKSVAALKPAGAIAPLTKLATKGKSLPARAGAVQALGGYGDNKKQRVKILAALVETMLRTYEAEQSAQRNPKGAKGTEAWQTLGGPLLAALNQLTGRSEKDAEAWVELWKQNKKKPAGLFPPAD